MDQLQLIGCRAVLGGRTLQDLPDDDLPPYLYSTQDLRSTELGHILQSETVCRFPRARPVLFVQLVHNIAAVRPRIHIPSDEVGYLFVS